MSAVVQPPVTLSEESACLFENPGRLVSLREMLEFSAHKFLAVGDFLQRMSAFLQFPVHRDQPLKIPGFLLPAEQEDLRRHNQEIDAINAQVLKGQRDSVTEVIEQLTPLRDECAALGLRCSVAHIKRILSAQSSPTPPIKRIGEALSELSSRIHDELEAQAFLALDSSEQEFYRNPVMGWERAISHFPEIRDDVEEASKCYALGRYAATIFHLMRITEAAVLELGKVVDPNDYKPQFGSVLNKIDLLVQKTKWQDWPEAAKPRKQLFIEVLPRLYAVKDSWRDKASHFGTHVVPTDAVSNGERAIDVYNSTQSLLRLLAEQIA